MSDNTHPAVAELIECGQHYGCITFNQLIALLPDDYVEPDKVDQLLATFEQLGIGLVDDGQAPAELRRKPGQQKRSGDTPEVDLAAEVAADEAPDDPELVVDERAKAEIVEALQDVSSKRIDDPVRMYLTQMGEISLLTRDEEIRLAKKIETTPHDLPPQGARKRLLDAAARWKCWRWSTKAICRLTAR